MPEDARETAEERCGPEHSGAALRFAAAGGLGSAEVGHATDGRAGDWGGDRSGRRDHPLLDPLLRGVVDATALLAGLLLAFCGIVLVARRLAGAMTTSPGPAAILAACAVAVMLLLVADCGSRRGTARAAGWLARLGLLATVASVALPLRTTAPAAAIAALVALGLSATAAAIGVTAAVRRRAGRRASALGRTTTLAFPPPVVEAVATPPVSAVDWGDGMRQRFERLTLADGTECVRGRVRVSVAAGSRLGVAHVGFCPPLAVAPTVEAATDYDGVEAVVSAAEVLPWGVRIECRLDEPAEETIDIPVDLLATAPV